MISIEVRVSLCRRCLGMSQQLADDRQAQTTTCAEARIGVAQIVKAHAAEAGALRNRLPGSFQIGARLMGLVARHDV